MSNTTKDSFVKRMKTDRAFRARMLRAGREGMAEALEAEGYRFAPSDLARSLPAVQTGLRAGTSFCSCACSCNNLYRRGHRAVRDLRVPPTLRGRS